MKPKNIRKYYSDFLEGNLDRADRERFLKILRSDPELQADYDEFARTHNLLDQLPHEEAEPGFEQKVLERLHREEGASDRLFSRMPWLTWQAVSAAAVVSLIIVAVSLVFKQPPATDETPAVTNAGITLEIAGNRHSAVRHLPPSLRDPVLVSRIDEISALIDEIDTLRNQYALRNDEIVLGQGSGQEFVFRPGEFYRRAMQASQSRPEGDDSVRHASAY
jgi:hypothetical protein